jgi:hypothetical protein
MWNDSNSLRHRLHAAHTANWQNFDRFRTARLCKAKKVLFLTKKKAIESIKSDYNDFYFHYELLVTNYESIHKVRFVPDLLILDEAHSIGAFPKPSQRTKLIKQMFAHLPMIMLSGTPASESYSQWFHQFWVSNRGPFKGLHKLL